MACTASAGRVKAILYGLLVIILAALFIGFLLAYINERNKNDATEVTTQSPSPPTQPPLTPEEIRLDGSVIPENYVLTIISDPNKNYFNGTIRIDLNVQDDQVNSIAIHCKNLYLHNYTILTQSESIKISSVDIDPRREQCIFKLDQPIQNGSGNALQIIFSGNFDDGQITGFYRSQYRTLSNQARYLTATKFEPTYARMAFPCFDEPAMKATFEIEIIHPDGYKALSNEIEQETRPTDKPGFSKTTFFKTKKMSTYLVAFVISDFAYTETKTISGTRVRVYSRPDQVHKTKYAVDAAAEILSFYENYTQIPYKFHKMDLIGLPEFVSGAMENWGLVTYKETYVLFDDNESSVIDMKQIASVIAHELAHMWFGNLVTLEWWNDLWIQEGFASFIEFKGQDFLNNSWKVWDRFLIEDLHGALRSDSLESAQALSPKSDEILSPDRITAMFNTISYSKGASILFMIQNIIGKLRFQEAAQKYLSENKYSVADTDRMTSYFHSDIQQVVGCESGKKFLDKWLHHNGFPIISVKRSNDSHNSRLILRQTPYFQSDDTSSNKDIEPWQVYVSLLHPKVSMKSFLLNQTEQAFNLDFDLSPKDWIKLNPGGGNYYIVNYDLSDWDLLINELKRRPETFSSTDRANLLFDAHRLTDAEVDPFPLDRLMNFFEYLKQEQNYIPWSVASSAINSLSSKLGDSGMTLVQYKNFAKNLVADVYDAKVNLDKPDSGLTYDGILLRNQLISLACSLGYEKCMKDCYGKFRKWLDQKEKIDPSIKSSVYKYGLQASANEADWQYLWDLYQSEKDAIEKSKLISALSATQDANLLSLLISYSEDQSKINNENFFSVQQSIASNSEVGRSLVWEYIKDHWKDLIERFSLNDRRLGNYVRSVVSGFRTESRLKEVSEFFEDNPDAGAGEGARKEAIETIKKNIKWSKDNLHEIAKSMNERDHNLKPWLNWRLDQKIRPCSYEINLTVDVDQKKFEGSVRIKIDVQRPIRYLILHSKDLEIKSSIVYTASDHVPVSNTSSNATLYKPNQFLVIPMEDIILPNLYLAEISFSGELKSELSGLYLSRYNNSKTNNWTYLATTQFEAGYARKAFPCFDEPQFKATFTLSVEHNGNYSSISNMPIDYIQESSTIDGWKQTVFQKSVPMATYLVALVVSDFKQNPSELESNFSVYTYNPEINLAKTNYALSVGPRILDYYAEKYFDIGYPLPKLDMISVPDFLMGAMENWGLVTYRDVYLLYDKNETSSASKITICKIIAHELAHMWFGNLVTMQWWDDLWLNEGFATFMQYKATHYVEPSWNYPEYYVINELGRVYESDSLPSTHAILTKVTDDNSIQAVFDSVTYAKGASIIRMVEAMIGEDEFRSGIKNYMNKNLYSNTVTNDLWSELTLVAPDRTLDVSEFMSTWVTKEGFPVITVTWSQTDNTLNLEQERFLKDYSYSNSSYIWSIPITYRLIDTENPEVINEIKSFNMKNKKMIQYNLTSSISDKIIKFNVDQKGLYVVNYPTEQWKKWIKELNNATSAVWKRTSTLDRHNLLIDAFYLARSGRLSYKTCLKLAEFMQHERSYVVWQTASDMLNYLQVFASQQDQGVSFNNWVRKKLLKTIPKELGWKAEETDDMNRKQFRALILNLACSYDHKQCLEKATELFDKFMKDPSKVYDYADADTFSIFLYHTIRTSATQNRFEFLRQKYIEAQTTNEKMRYLRALSSVQDETMLQNLISNSLNTSYLRSQDFFTFLSYLASNPIGRELGWKFYCGNYSEIEKRYGLDDSNLGRAVYRFAFYFTTQQKREEIVELFDKYPDAGASSLFRQQALDLLDANIRWSSSFYNEVIEYLTENCDTTLCPWQQFRLNPKIIPEFYNLTIQINTNTFQYNGTVKILVNVDVNDDELCQYMIVHAANILDVSKPSIREQNSDDELSTGNGFFYAPLEFYVIPLKEKLKKKGKYEIKAEFNGDLLKGGLVGLYRSWYDNTTSENQSDRINLAATQFESTHARKMFPCFDEPSFKSNISITVIHEKIMNTTLSNMDIIGSEDYKPGWQVTRYQTTPPMVTYLIAILVSDFHCSLSNHQQTNGTIPIRTCSSPLYSPNKHNYSLKATDSILSIYEKYTGILYGFPKLDQVAIPQFSPGAMENWGLINYREKRLLWSEDEDQSEDKREICAIIAHELAHMWFGNLVTMEFWGDLWLNEAFASYMEYSAVDYTEPDWNYWDIFAYSDTYQAILGDYEQESEPIIRNVDTLKKMPYSSRIVYNKGATILNMFNQTMGSENFQKSLRSYLNDRKYKTATTEDLFKAFEKNWNHSMSSIEFFDSWTRKPGFPYLNISLNDDGTYSYSQQRFIRTGEKPLKDQTYVIPFQYYEKNEGSLKKSDIQFLDKTSGILDGKSILSVKVNPNFNGFYFVNYPEQIWSSISKELLNNTDNIVDKLTVNDRSELIVSSYFLSRAKLAPKLISFELFNYLVNEPNYTPWQFYEKLIANLAWEMDRTEYRESYKRFERRLTSAHYTNISFWDDTRGTLSDKIFRKTLINLACGSGNRQCLRDAKMKFEEWKNGESIPPNLFTATLHFGTYFSESIEEDLEFIWQRFLAESYKSSNKLGYLEAIAYISDSDLVEKYLNKALDEKIVSKENFIYFFKQIIDRYQHESMIWEYFTENYPMLSRKLSTPEIDGILMAISDHTVTEKKQSEIRNFFKNQPVSDRGVSLHGRQTAFSSIQYNLAWMSKNKIEVGEWFSNNACGNKPEQCPWARLRIDQGQIMPKHYEVIVQVNLTNNIYNGSVRIQVNATKDFQYITLHAAEMLQVKLFAVNNNQSKPIENVTLFRYLPNQFVVLEFEELQPSGQYELIFNFSANLLDAGLSGLYLSNYTDGKDQFKMASTQFEFYDARKVFPCFDEPAFKSKFNVTIIHDASMNTTLSNMDISEETSLPATGWIKTKFKESVEMTTYLVAMVVSSFVCESNIISNVTYRVCASHLQQHKLGYALEKAPICLEHLEKKLNQAFPLDKVDLIGVPDFYYGAMENWGLITFRESALLHHDNDTTSQRKMSILNTVAHEIAHFWFGNLVTCEWWDYITLNEGFATYMQYTSLNEAEPDWEIFDQFLMSDFEYALSADSKDNHPLIRNVTATNQIEQSDSNIIYSKGATILRMIESVMGTDSFYKALREYLEEFKYRSVRPEDLLSKLDNNFKPNDSMNMSDFLQDWLFSNGVPYVNVTYENGWSVKQDRFLLQSAKNKTKPIWKIPISYYTNNNSFTDNKTEFLTTTSANLVGIPKSIEMLKLNVGHQGFYLVNYSPDLWDKWIEFLHTSSAENWPSVSDRAGLLMDSFYLARAQLISYNIPLNLARYLTKEKHITPWTIAIRGFASIQNYVNQGSSYGGKFQSYLQELVKPIYDDLGWLDESSDVIRSLRSTILDFACSNQLPDCLSHSKSEFRKWINNEEIPPPNLLSTVLKYGLKSSNDSFNDWLFVWSKYQNETSATLKSIYMTALASTQDEKLLKMLMTQALDAKVVRSQDSYSVLTAIAAIDNPQGLKLLWQFYQENYTKMIASGSPLKISQIYGLLSTIANRYFFSQAQKDQLQRFFADNPVSTGGIGLSLGQRQNILNAVDSNIKWIKQRMIEVERFLLCGSDSCPFTEFRLNPKVVPQSYELSLKVDLDSEKFEGTVIIRVDVQEEIRYVILHAAKTLQISNSEVKDAQNNTLDIEKNFRHDSYEFWVVEMKQPIKSGLIFLRFDFNSSLATDMQGFYLSKYKDENGALVKLASTQFQDVYARRAFPCFDETQFKATFKVKIRHDPKYSAMSNTMETITRNDSSTEMVETEFEETPPMVTYLVAFIISKFECRKTDTTIMKRIQVCASPQEYNNTEYSFEMAPKLIETYQNKFGINYTLDKMDLVAIPDFKAGAMENWGLLTFRETALLWNDATTSAANKMSLLAVVAHEIAHMWFGNLVTCQWWNDLWLNEAFASYLEWFSVSSVEPDWDYEQLFYITDYISGMNADASITAHPLSRGPINSPSEIPYITNIIYQKGSSILRMFEFVLKTEPFYDQLRTYLKENSYGTVTARIFVDKLSKAKVDGLNDTGSFLESWIFQAGFPILTLTKENNKYTVVQERFLSSEVTTEQKQTWIVPLSYYADYSSSENYSIKYIDQQSQEIDLSDTKKDLPIKFNVDSKGFYIVNYPEEDWRQWVNVFQNKTLYKSLKLTSQDYSHLMYDAFRLANKNLLSFDVVIDLLSILKTDLQLSVWSTGSSIWNQLWPYFRNSDPNDQFSVDSLMSKTYQKFAHQLVRDAYNEFNLQKEKDSINDQRLRSVVSSFACAYGYDLCLAEAQVEFKKWRSDLTPYISPNVITTVLRYAIQASTDSDDWNFLWEKYKTEQSTVAKLNYLQGLTQTKDKNLLNQLLLHADDQNLVRRQDYLSLYSYLLRTPTGFEVGWKYFQENYRKILKDRLSQGEMGRLATYFASYLYTNADQQIFQRFFQQHPDTGVSSVYLNQALETISINVKWVENYRQKIYEKLRQ